MLRNLVCIFCISFFFCKTVSSQVMVGQVYGISVAVYSWDHSMPLQQYLESIDSGQKYITQRVVILGCNGRSVFSLETVDCDNSKGLYCTNVAETDVNGNRKTWSPDVVSELSGGTRNRNTVNLHIGKLKPVEAWPCVTSFSWVVKVNIAQLQKCFTWYFDPASDSEMDDDVSDDFIVKTGPYEYTKALKMREAFLTVPIPCRVDSLPSLNWTVISKADTFQVSIRYDTLTPIPFRWINAVYSGDSSALIKAESEMKNPDSILVNAYPLLKTHRAQVITVKYFDNQTFKEESYPVLDLCPVKDAPGKCYSFVLDFCAADKGYVMACAISSDFAKRKNTCTVLNTLWACY